MNITFEFKEGLSDVLESKKHEILHNSIDGIKQAVTENKDLAEICSLELQEDGTIYKLQLKKKYWKQVLNECIGYFRSVNDSNTCIEAYEILKTVETQN